MSADEWDGLKASRMKTREFRRKRMRFTVDRLGLGNRVKFINDGTCVLDGKHYYYAQKRVVRTKGQSEYIAVESFDEFLRMFAHDAQAAHEPASDDQQAMVMPVGKYKGQPIEVLRGDRGYADWVLTQPWLLKRLGGRENFLRIVQPSEQPPSDG